MSPSTTNPLYFSHSYRREDRAINEFFWELFQEAGFYFTVDPKSDVLSVAYLELMLKQSAAFAAVVTKRAEQLPHRCSPFMLYEYGLAVQAQKPRLVFVETGVSDAYFQEKQNTVVFDRNGARLTADKSKFRAAIDALSTVARPGENYGDKQLLGRAGLVLGGSPYSRRVYTSSLVMKLTTLLENAGFTPETIDIHAENTLKLLLQLDRAQLVLVDVGPSLSPPWVYPLLRGRFIPTMRLFYLGQDEHRKARGNPLLTEPFLRDASAMDEPIIFWRNEDDLLEKLSRQLQKFAIDRTQFHSLDEGYAYFSSIGRPPARVFLSNANDANDLAREVVAGLKRKSISIFQYIHANTIPIGSEWDRGLIAEVERADIFVQLLSAGYWNSEWCRREYEIASRMQADGRQTLVPFFVEHVAGPQLRTQGRSVIGKPRHEQAREVIGAIDSLVDTLDTSRATGPASPKWKSTQTADIAIVTIIKEEYAAVLGQLDDHAPPGPRDAGDVNLYAWELGTLNAPGHHQPYVVVTAFAGRAGTAAAMAATLETVNRWNPRYLLLVGIAGGLGADRVRKGDVVVPDYIWGYEYGKLDDDFEPRHNNTYQVDTSLLTAAQSLDVRFPDWWRKVNLRAPLGRVEPQLRIGPVASGDKVVDNAAHPVFRRVRNSNPKLIAVEMESAGAMAAIQTLRERGSTVGFGMIRGISDLPLMGNEEDGFRHARGANRVTTQTAERDSWKELAADTAATFAVQLIRHGWPVPPQARS